MSIPIPDDYEPSEDDLYEDDPYDDEYDGFEVYESADEYIERFAYRGDDDDEDE